MPQEGAYLMRGWIVVFLVACGGSHASLDAETQALYDTTCAGCHEAGAADSPRRGDVADWSRRARYGEDALLRSVKDGMVAMPPRGMCGSCSDDQFRDMIRYLQGSDGA